MFVMRSPLIRSGRVPNWPVRYVKVRLLGFALCNVRVARIADADTDADADARVVI
jgi:hypothetical protein